MTTHSKMYPPSGGWPLCPSWEHDPTPSAAADVGTKRHAIAEAWLKWRLENPDRETPWTWSPTVEVNGQPVQVTSEDVEQVNLVLPYLDKHPAVVSNGKPGHRVWVEQKVDFGTAIGRPGEDFTGTCDVLLLTPNTLEVLDHKFGHKTVTPPTSQSKLYALGAGGLIYSPENAAQAAQLRTVKLTISQPTNPQGPIQTWEGSIDVMVEWAKWAKERVTAREKFNGFQFDPSEDACRYCARANTCQARMTAAADLLENVAAPQTSQSPPSTMQQETPPMTPATPSMPPLAPAERIQSLAETYAGTDVEEIADEDLGRFLDVWGQLRAFGKDMEEEGKRRLMAGRRIPGWKMVPGKRTRRVKEKYKDEFEDLLLKLSGVRKKDVYETRLKSLAQLEKVVTTNCGQIVQRRFAEMWEMTDGTPVLATEDDPRSGVNPTPEYLEDVETVNPNNAITMQEAEKGEPIEDWF